MFMCYIKLLFAYMYQTVPTVCVDNDYYALLTETQTVPNSHIFVPFPDLLCSQSE